VNVSCHGVRHHKLDQFPPTRILRGGPASPSFFSSKAANRETAEYLQNPRSQAHGGQTRPLSAPIQDPNTHIQNKGFSTLETWIILGRSKPGPSPDQPISPIISARW